MNVINQVPIVHEYYCTHVWQSLNCGCQSINFTLAGFCTVGATLYPVGMQLAELLLKDLSTDE